MKIKTSVIIRLLIALVLVTIIFIDTIIIRQLNKKIENITILTYDSDSLVAFTPKSNNKPIIVVTPNFIDKYTKYHSPFNDGLTFNELMKKYIRNSWADQYGTPRGNKKHRRIHEGIDLYVPENTPVYPLADYGIVTEVSDNPHYLIQVESTNPKGEIDSVKVEYGKIVRILYPEGIVSVYAHLSEVFVELGQEVNRNTKVGLTGRTGNIRNSGKPSHLHMELRYDNNKSFDPRYRLRFKGSSIKHFLEFLKIGEN